MNGYNIICNSFYMLQELMGINWQFKYIKGSILGGEGEIRTLGRV